MKHYAGLDASVKETSMCIIDEAGKTTRETKVASEPEVILAVLMDEALTMRSRPSGVRRAFLCMSIRLLLRLSEVSTTSASSVGAGWTTY